MPEYEVMYFEATGRAEAIRLMFSYAGIPFKDTRVTFDEWPELKKDTTKVPYQVLPVLFVDDKLLAESHTIYRYVAKLTGLTGGPDPFDEAVVDQAHEVCRGFNDAAYGYVYVVLGFWKQDKNEAYKNILLPNVEKYFPRISALLQPSGYFGKNGPTYADFSFCQTIEGYNSMVPEVVAKYPEFLAHYERMMKLPQIQDYLKNRPAAKCTMILKKSSKLVIVFRKRNDLYFF
ncbi:unnamed protein product [Bursaphelenchus okinawaensis]|uniref:glutathione transferase n=1 Tax=Bursaphelenchus okinawaensis TaxID=465554 RepID=A0A811KC82_9BILA|nr:unnamed protein product [Bursaphelenchus okinawaensis]CAG9101478.1 unnamed protein product [Bursaphelenchus okinawaensis]